jgi:hypothetical protein
VHSRQLALEEEAPSVVLYVPRLHAEQAEPNTLR